ncbi:MAG: flavodoxin domain-containing protein [Alphaproteobacteria bacterium]|nr:flavodoxin domain-containing protein [Alphaproteobacteria bacterium]
MSAAPLLPKNAPFTADDIKTLNSLVQRTTPLQRSWLSGFFAGIDAAGQGVGAQQAASDRPKTPLTILYASESGNAETLALKAKKLAQKQHFDARVTDMADADLELLGKAKNVLAYVATYGEGDPPERAADFYAAMMSDAAPRLEGVKFAVLALGDTAYVNFCQTGREVDERLEALGGERIADRIDLDLDFKKAAAAWTEKAIGILAPEDAGDPDTVVHVDFSGGFGLDDDAEPVYEEDNPLEAEISELINLNGSGSSQETLHVELAFDDPQFVYKPGDAIGVLPSNDPAVAEQILQSVGLSSDDGLRDELVSKYDITTLSRPVLKNYGALIGNKAVEALAEPDALAAYTADRQLMDLFGDHPEKLTKDQLIGLLRPLPGRLYSVASSLKAHPGEAHLLIGTVRWHAHGRSHGGVTSTYFADRRKRGDTARIYVKPNRRFGVPDDPERPMIMIGAGTGVAPYRGFVEERMETGAKGKNWLLFGERNFTNDFLYQLEWQDFIEDGFLHRIDLAFSRDQPEKIYVQDRLWQAKDAVRDWIADGAHIYVCGDEKHMAKDVDQTLINILAEGEGGDKEKARTKLKELSKAGRYQRDVY